MPVSDLAAAAPRTVTRPYAAVPPVIDRPALEQLAERLAADSLGATRDDVELLARGVLDLLACAEHLGALLSGSVKEVAAVKLERDSVRAQRDSALAARDCAVARERLANQRLIAASVEGARAKVALARATERGCSTIIVDVPVPEVV